MDKSILSKHLTSLRKKVEPRIWISEMKFSDETTITFDKNDIVVFVGPNNVGKSAVLKEAAKKVQNINFKGKVLEDLKFEKLGDKLELINFIKSKSLQFFYDVPTLSEPGFEGKGYRLYSENAITSWQNCKKGITDLFPLFVKEITTEERIIAADPPNNINIINEVPNHPIHYLQSDDSIENTFCEVFKKAFGMDLVLHRNAGSNVPLYVGKKPIPRDGEDRVSRRYLDELEKLDLLHLQGDGMRSFVGILLNTFINLQSIVFIDEPEAFLHPPQARLIGKMLAKDLPKERQLFLATHSADFLLGLLDAEIDNLKIIRIEREDNINHIKVLNNQDIQDVWSDSLLRHSNILNGLFHSKVVICEGDSDCRFYSSILSSIHDNSNTIAPDILFTHTGGKDRMPVAIKALKKMNVDLKIICDFDVLNAVYPLKDIYESLGGFWVEVSTDWNRVKKAIDEKKPDLEKSELKINIDKIFETISDNIISKQKIKEINDLFKKSSPWSIAKTLGNAYIPNGDATKSFDTIQLKFKEKGLIILDVGEVESFVKSIGGHGPSWVNEVLKKNLKDDTELEKARQFIKNFIL